MSARDELHRLFESGRTSYRLDDLIDTVAADAVRAAADAYEHDQAAQNPGPIFGAIRRIRSYDVGAWLRARADVISKEQQ